MELICHGVIDQLYWKDYIDLLKNKHHMTITNFTFRCKDKQKRYFASFEGNSKRNGKAKKLYTTPALSYYYKNFLSGYILRENCYKCPFASKIRNSDITVGDYWGYQGDIDSINGISVMIVNTIKGNELFHQAESLMLVDIKTFDDAAKTNEQLLRPFDINKKRYELLESWSKHGAYYLDKEHRRRHWKAVLASKIGVY